MKNKQKKISFQSVAFGCTVFSAILVGAWFLFPLEEMIAERLPASQPVQRRRPTSISTTKIASGEKIAAKGKKTAPNLIAKKSTELQEQTKMAAILPTDLAPRAQLSTVETPLGEEEQLSEEQDSPAPSCRQQIAGLQFFFNQIEQQEYIKEPVPDLQGLVSKLSASHPVVLRETDDLYTILS
ncbi:MAG: hypothetical protein D3923_13050, partial [Candidatus Electrothrix sp. AR3]|nr:hypothetical protein [Candidatus Electrothrix sp. AR3]